MSFIDKASNLNGPLPPSYRKAIFSYLQNPTFEGWDGIYSIVINWGGRHKTVWQALIAVDSVWNDIALQYSARSPPEPRLRWKRIPDAVTLARALKKTLDKQG